MKPIRLEMKAFGPFAGQAAPIDFEAFGSGIYLITGDTGTGKTTIFDAMMFALFEEVSRSNARGKDENPEAIRSKRMMHSDYAPKSEPSVVRLVFEADGRRYTVERRILFKKKRAGGYGDPEYYAELTGGAEAVEGSLRVTKAVEGILHMNAVQFRQIVMLAQGEFRAFMEAKDDARKDILGRLFESGLYTRYQTVFLKAQQRLLRQREEGRSRIRACVDPAAFFLPEETEEAERALYAPEHPALA